MLVLDTQDPGRQCPGRTTTRSTRVRHGQDDELNITVSRTWLEVSGVDDPASWAFDFAKAVFAGKLEEAGIGDDGFIQVVTRHGIESGDRLHLCQLTAWECVLGKVGSWRTTWPSAWMGGTSLVGRSRRRVRARSTGSATSQTRRGRR